MSEKVFAVLGLFEDPQSLLDAIPRVKASGFERLEAYTPYPVHGLDRALGLRRSPLAGMVMVMGILGAVTALFFQWWMSAVDYPIEVGGKALNSWQAFVPIMFEVTVLFATFTAGLGMLLLLNKLPFFGHPVLASKAIARTTRDRFALAVEAGAGTLDAQAARDALLAAGAAEIEVLAEPERGLLSPRYWSRAALGIAIACAVSGYLMYWAVKLYPAVAPMVHMEDQPKLNPQEADAFFKDGHGMQLPVAGTVARGHMPYPFKDQQEAAVLVNPLPRTPQVLKAGKTLFDQHCAVCHGALGTGVPTLTAAYGAKPANLQADTFRNYPDGMIYHVIVMGKNAMPSYAADLSEKERWEVVHYVRVLQRAQNAKEGDIP